MNATDLLMIQQLTARYNHALDNREVEAWLECWTPDGSFERFESQPRASGHEELSELIRTFPVVGRHMTTDAIVTLEGDEASQVCYCLYLDIGRGCETSMFGVYRDRLVRTPEGWRFAHRVFHPDYISQATP